MTTFDDRFADRVREAFDAYEEPVDERALARLQAALGTAGAPAPDRAALPRGEAARVRWRGLSVLLVLLVAGGVWLALADRSAPTDRLGAAGGPPAPEVTGADAPQAGADAPPEAPPLLAEGAAPRSAPLSASGPALARPAPPAPHETPVAPPESRPVPGDASPPAAGPAPPPPVAVPSPPATERVAAHPPSALPPRPAPGRSAAPPPPVRLGEPASESDGVRLVVASNVVGSGDRVAEGAGLAAGLSQEWAVSRRVAVSGGALLAYGRSVPAPSGPDVADVFSDLARSPGEEAEVTERSVVTTVAVEVPVDVAVDVARVARARVRASVGLTSALYLQQTFEDEGTRYASETLGEGSTVSLTSEAYAADESVGVLGRLDLGRQLNLGLGLVGPRADALGLDVYVRLPLGGVTSRDLPLTVVGVRLRAPLP